MRAASLTRLLAAAGAAALFVALSAAPAAQAQHRAHVHGFVALNVALQGGRLSVQLEAPLDSLVGFEHRPRTDAQRKAADAALALINKPQDWLQPSAAAQCTLSRVEVQADVLQPAAANAKPPKPPKPAKDEHADLDASFDYQCDAPAQLAALELKLFEAFARINRIDVQVVGPQGQHKQTLRRGGGATVRLQR